MKLISKWRHIWIALTFSSAGWTGTDFLKTIWNLTLEYCLSLFSCAKLSNLKYVHARISTYRMSALGVRECKILTIQKTKILKVWLKPRVANSLFIIGLQLFLFFLTAPFGSKPLVTTSNFQAKATTNILNFMGPLGAAGLLFCNP